MAITDSGQKKVLSAKDAHKKYFEKIQKTGSAPTHPGIYECQKCGYEDLINRECTKLPPCSECSGSDWKMSVFAQNSDQKGGKPL
ncbi:hypothetical protein LOY57_03110 [Pseudomonas moraviensis]|uniref:hypothetical protein n=1 Tax=Pseudomonas moraviensis TaxID=321662 RepID=UPI00215E715F|nr:hypothetical protein [Pseudomonas moraviensis]UVL46808.1 hypothetical protein LOY57_03110 [Pseudomonas moraviensis]